MGPKFAAELFRGRTPDADAYRVTLYGSLAATGKGHMTDVAVTQGLGGGENIEIVWRPDTVLPYHTNGMLFEALKGGLIIDSNEYFSVGGGKVVDPKNPLPEKHIYPLTSIEEIIEEGSLSYSGTGSATLMVEVVEVVDDRVSATLTATNFSDNVDTVWFIRYNGLKDEVEQQVRESLSEYVERGKILGSYKIAKEDIGVKYIDGGSSWDPKYEALQSYDASWGGDIIVMVILDTDGKVKIHSYYAAGREVTKL